MIRYNEKLNNIVSERKRNPIIRINNTAATPGRSGIDFSNVKRSISRNGFNRNNGASTSIKLNN